MGPSFPVWEHSSSTQSWCSHQCPVPAEKAAFSFLCPPLTKVLISCTTTFSEGAMCPANNWHSVVSVSPNGIWVPIECDPCRLPQALGHWGGDGRGSLAVALNFGPGQWVALARALYLCKTQPLACLPTPQLANQPKVRGPRGPWQRCCSLYFKYREYDSKKFATVNHMPPSPFLEVGFAESFWVFQEDFFLRGVCVCVWLLVELVF